ncbi:ASCH domain-containing protein [Loigolactobacillus zhaoyuanensis]|uniref:ASCH domain-containing protein n=1 Tax=Loigolactobacillus zhaoyuanensis TaxID=2486017 RepID=A0ABW8UE57_9LACO|nr:ASCH domain-containing protein [Loigolactobacillus zhaoyuanensis]
MENESAIKMWTTFTTEHPEVKSGFDAWSFGANPQMADDLANLVIKRKKTATASNYILYKLTNMPLPQVGEYSIILDGHQQAVAIIRTTAVDLVPFGDVSADHAFAEGEGDRTLAYWRQVHKKFFTEELATTHEPFTEQTLVLLERFMLLYHY